MKQYVPFKIRYDFQQRKQKFIAQKKQSPNLIPLIIQPNPSSSLPPLKNCRLCCQGQKNLLYLKLSIASKVYESNQNQGFYIYIGKSLLVDTSRNIQSLYRQFKDKDGFLYINYAQMQMFGSNLP